MKKSIKTKRATCSFQKKTVVLKMVKTCWLVFFETPEKQVENRGFRGFFGNSHSNLHFSVQIQFSYKISPILSIISLLPQPHWAICPLYRYEKWKARGYLMLNSDPQNGPLFRHSVFFWFDWDIIGGDLFRGDPSPTPTQKKIVAFLMSGPQIFEFFYLIRVIYWCTFWFYVINQG